MLLKFNVYSNWLKKTTKSELEKTIALQFGVNLDALQLEVVQCLLLQKMLREKLSEYFWLC